MFSGNVAGMGRVVTLTSLEPGTRLVVHAPGLLDGVVEGESVAVNGVCLTAAGRPATDEIAFDLMPETPRRSNLGGLVAGDPINLERSLRFGDRIGGHLVQGHIDGIAEVISVVPESLSWRRKPSASSVTPRFLIVTRPTSRSRRNARRALRFNGMESVTVKRRA